MTPELYQLIDIAKWMLGIFVVAYLLETVIYGGN